MHKSYDVSICKLFLQFIPLEKSGIGYKKISNYLREIIGWDKEGCKMRKVALKCFTFDE
jgi:hypothetical protein